MEYIYVIKSQQDLSSSKDHAWPVLLPPRGFISLEVASSWTYKHAGQRCTLPIGIEQIDAQV